MNLSSCLFNMFNKLMYKINAITKARKKKKKKPRIKNRKKRTRKKNKRTNLLNRMPEPL